jgi:nucleoside-diphosphate-sugar epimerase
MRLVILGANGQVGAEVTMMLANVVGVELRPVVRSRGGSAFLRYSGIPVLHGDVSNPDEARLLLSGARLIANFAIASGTPAEAISRNNEIIRQTFFASPPESTIVFFSTLSVHGQCDDEGRHAKTFYGEMKLKNERLVSLLSKRLGRKAYILRLGHVAGQFQNAADLIRREIEAGPVPMIDPERASNVTFTEMITEALLAIASEKAGPPGLYDLVNIPQWTWREVYAHEAQKLGKPLKIEKAQDNKQASQPSLRLKAIKMAGQFGLKERLLRGASHLPGPINARLEADYYVSRASSEIQALKKQLSPANSAMYWPEVSPIHLSGVRTTRELIDAGAYPIYDKGKQRWPIDLVY